MARGMRRVPTYYQDLIDVLGANPGHVIGSTACFKAGTQVETKEGWKSIENINAGDYVVNQFGEWEEVIEPTSMMTHQYGYSIEITGNERPIVCTDNHEFLTITNNSKIPKWVQAKDLNLTPSSNTKHIGLAPVNYTYKQDSILKRAEWDNSYLAENQFSHRRIHLPNEIKLTPELMRLFGLFLGDGCISLKINPRISFSFNETEFDNYMESFINSASKQLGISWSINKRPENHRVDISSSSVDLINLFYYLFGNVKADTKHFPARLRVSKELDYELVFGYLLADGHFRTRFYHGKATGYECGEFSSASISQHLSYDLYNILNQIGISSSISLSNKHIDKNGTKHKDAWYVTGSNKVLGRINKLIGYSHQDVVDIFNAAILAKMNDYITINNIRYRKIRFKSMKKIELNEIVYCLNNTTHSFKCENLIVHNCLGGALPTQILKAKKDGSVWEKIFVWIEQMKNLFGNGNFYFELQPSKNPEQVFVNRKLIELSNQFNVPYIITTDTHYLKKEDRPIHKAYLNAQNGDREVDDFYATTYLMDTEELESYLDLTIPELKSAYDSIRRIGAMCEDYSLLKPLKIPQLPWRDLGTYTINQRHWISEIPYLEEFWNSEYEGDQKLADAITLKLESVEALQKKEIYEAVNECLRMTWISSEVNKAHWSAYYLNLQRIIEECWNAGTLVGPGRGSGVGFILLYLLDITQINPQWETVQTFPWRFLNPSRVSVLDVDCDIEGGRRKQVLDHLRKVYGDDRVSNVATFRTEKSKSSILTAARGLGIDVDIAQYIASLIPADRGQIRSLDQCMYGDEESGWAPVKQFVFEMTENYPELWEVAHKIEGLVCGIGVHAGGVIFVDEPFEESTALMRAPDGTLCTQFDLHDSEACSLIKYDLLSVEAMDKIHICLDLLCDNGYAERKDTLRETYENVVGIYNLERIEPKMWEMVWNHEIQSLFQMEKSSGLNGIALTKPESVDDLAHLNSIIRLMAQEKGGEIPLNKYARFKNDIRLWYDEMEAAGLTRDEMTLLEPIIKGSYGICESQEAFMQLVQIPECGGFDLNFADQLRKAIAKKNPKAYDELTKQYFENCKEKKLSRNLCNYVWNTLIATSRGYGFNLSHTLSYSLIALQEMNLAYRYPVIFWNCACLISDAGGAESFDEDDEVLITCQEEYDDFMDFSAEDSDEEDEDDDEDESVVEKKKKKTKTTNYGKIASAIGKFKSNGIEVAPPDINKSTYTFSPDVNNNTIRYGLSGITKVGEEIVKTIIENRPYKSVEDFLKRIKVNKPQMVNLIKSGAFDCFGDRYEIMKDYIARISDAKKRITLQNMKMLCDFGLIPDEYDLQRRVYNFNKYLKKFKSGAVYLLDEVAIQFYESHFSMDNLTADAEAESGFSILQREWDKIYQSHMDIIRPWVKKNADKLLEQVNNLLMKDMWDKYALGSLSKWEMDSVSFYSHPHELRGNGLNRFGVTPLGDIPEEPIVEKVLTIKGRQIPIFKLYRIAGTVLDKDKNKKTVTLLTTDGVISVKIYGQVYSYYDKQISERSADGKKHVIEKSFLSRGNKIIITGIRQTDGFLAKKYARTPYHLVELITDIDENGAIKVKGERMEVNE